MNNNLPVARMVMTPADIKTQLALVEASFDRDWARARNPTYVLRCDEITHLTDPMDLAEANDSNSRPSGRAAYSPQALGKVSKDAYRRSLNKNKRFDRKRFR